MSYQISGRTIDSSGNGVKNLIIVFYDVDKKFKFPKKLKVSHINFLESIGSERLGSTYSKDDGAFEFSFDYEDFAPDKEEKRPDIVVLVLSPEEKEKKLKTRVLYVSNYPLSNGGQNEALLINVSNHSLSNVDTISTNSETKVLALLRSIEENEKEVRLIKEKVAPKIVEKLTKTVERKKITNKLFQNLSTVPKKLRENYLFLGKDDILEKAVEKNLEKGVKRLNFDKPTYMPMILTSQNLNDLGYDSNTTNPIDKIQIPYNKYCGLLNEKTKGKTLIRKKTLKEALREVLGNSDYDTSIDEGTSNDVDEERNTNQDIITDTNKSAYINKKVAEIYGPLQNTIDNSILHTNLKTRIDFDDKVSPVNQKAFHDFHSLQIAFEDIWKEVLDNTLEEKFKEWYDEIVNAIEEYHSDWQPLTENEIQIREELERAVNQESMNFIEIISILNEKSLILGEGLSLPKKLIDYNLPNIDNWDELSISQQTNILRILEKKQLDSYDTKSDFEKINFLIELIEKNFDSIIKNIPWEPKTTDEYTGMSLSQLYRIKYNEITQKYIKESGSLPGNRFKRGSDYLKNREAFMNL